MLTGIHIKFCLRNTMVVKSINSKETTICKMKTIFMLNVPFYFLYNSALITVSNIIWMWWEFFWENCRWHQPSHDHDFYSYNLYGNNLRLFPVLNSSEIDLIISHNIKQNKWEPYVSIARFFIRRCTRFLHVLF